jgi:hypothetical protein
VGRRVRIPPLETSALYEYACHEGNYALPGILMGERVKDWAVTDTAAKPSR